MIMIHVQIESIIKYKNIRVVAVVFAHLTEYGTQRVQKGRV